MVYCQVIEVPQRLLDLINEYLSAANASEYQGEDNTISFTARFPNGYEMDVKCCGCDDAASWAEAVLFNEQGCELCFSEPDEQFVGDWEITYDGDTFKATIKAEEGKS